MSKRNPNSRSRPMLAGLMQSIQSEVIKTRNEINGSVFISENSAAKKYARKIHDEKFKTWKWRGVGTQAKGERADHKFIERAMNASEKSISDILESEISKALGAT